MAGNICFGSKVKITHAHVLDFSSHEDGIGASTVCFAIFAYFWLPRSPSTWWLLSDREKTVARARILADSSVTVDENLNIRDAFRPLKDPLYWFVVVASSAYLIDT